MNMVGLDQLLRYTTTGMYSFNLLVHGSGGGGGGCRKKNFMRGRIIDLENVGRRGSMDLISIVSIAFLFPLGH